ncbi:oleosin-B6 [Mus musculus]|nr:oleosin-B6 [Mus musculus]
MADVSAEKGKDAVALLRRPRHEPGKTALPQKGRRPEPRSSRKAAPETPRARRKRPSLKAAAAAPGHKGRPPASRPAGLTSSPVAQLTAPLRRAALTRPHARRGRGAAGIRAARFRPRFRFLAPPGLGRHGLPPAPVPAPAPAAALRAPGCPRLDPAFIWLTAPFSSAPPESQNNRSRAGAGRKRKAGRAEAARGDAGVWVRASRAAKARARSRAGSRRPPILRDGLEKSVPKVLFSGTWTSVQPQLFVFEVSTRDTDICRLGQSGGQHCTPGS